MNNENTFRTKSIPSNIDFFGWAKNYKENCDIIGQGFVEWEFYVEYRSWGVKNISVYATNVQIDYTVDRWTTAYSTSEFATTQSQETDVPSGQGFTNSYKFVVRTLSSSAEGVTRRGRVLVNGSYSHNFIGEVTAGASTEPISATFASEGYNGSTYYNANDTITIQFEIRNLDSGTGNRTQLDSGAYLSVFVFETS